MSPQPKILPIVAPSQSLPHTPTTNDNTTQSTSTGHVTMAQTMPTTTDSASSGVECGSVHTIVSSVSSETTTKLDAPSKGSASQSISSLTGTNEDCLQETVSPDSNPEQTKTLNVFEEKLAGDSDMSSEVSDQSNDSEDDLIGMGYPRKIYLKTINPHIICNLCKGYLIDATTIVECLHSFCHSCIMKHLHTEQYCPRCEMMINTAKPNIKPDTTLQAIVYKLVPGLYEKELLRKRAFFRDRPEEAMLATPEQRGEDTENLIFSPSEKISLSLEYADIEEIPEDDKTELSSPKYLQCPAIFTVALLKKFIISKFGIDSGRFSIEIMYKVKTIVLMDHYTVMDVAYIYTWKRDAPMRFFFRVKEYEKGLRKRKKHVERSSTLECEKESERNDETQSAETRCGSTESVGESSKNKETEKRNGQSNAECGSRNSQSDLKSADNSNHKNEISTSTRPSTPAREKNPANAENKKEIKISKNPDQAENCNVNQSPENKDKLKSEFHHSSNSDSKSEISSPEQSKSSKHEIKNDINANNKHTSEKSTIDIKTEKNKDLEVESTAGKTKMSASGKNKHLKNNATTDLSKCDTYFTKPSKNNKNTKHHPEERKVENIKLKIDLSKQSSVTIINMSSSPENSKKDNVKSVKFEKEWKPKTKNEKVTGAKYSSNSENKHHRFEIKNSPVVQNNKGLVPPITIKAERISSDGKKLPSPPLVATTSKEKQLDQEKDDEEKKSEFLNSFALTPIKPLQSPNKSDKPKLSPTNNVTASSNVDHSFTVPASIPVKSSQAVKRKSKEISKTLAKKAKMTAARSSDPYANVKGNSALNPGSPLSITFKLAPFPIGGSQTDLEKKKEDQKLMPAPPPLKVLHVLKKNGVKANKAAKSTKGAITNKMKSLTSIPNTQRVSLPGSFSPHPIVPAGIASSRIPITAVAPGNRTPRRYPPILPKSPRPNPFANIPADVNKLLENSGTEIKQITAGNNNDIKVYGPTAGGTINSSPKSTLNASSPQQSNTSSANRTSSKIQGANNYLNFALFNSSKSRISDVPLGSGTPIYVPGSPIYSPNSPQYLPNYNIPTQPTYKYTKPTSNSGSNYLQNVLEQNKQLSNLFPAPPTKKPPESAGSLNFKNKSPTPERDNKKLSSNEKSLRRSYSKSPPSLSDKNPETPEKQIKVQTLLNSCNINIPSSLSITITNDDGDSGINSSLNSKRKNPVNNYIEILKLPDNLPISPEKTDPKKPPTPTPPKRIEDAKPLIGGGNSNKSVLSAIPLVSSASTVTKSSSPTIMVKSFANTRLSPVKPASQINSTEKKSEIDVSSNSATKTAKTKKTASPEKKTTEKQQKKGNQTPSDKKASLENASGAKTVKRASSTPPPTQPSKKFRHILPRTTTPSQASSKHGNTTALTTTCKESPKAQQSQNSPPAAAAAAAASSVVAKTSPLKKPEDILASKSSLNSNSKSPQPTSQPSYPDFSTFLGESLLLRAQQQAVNNANGVFIPHLAAAANFNPHFASVNFGYNMQQALLMDHITRMQKAGHEALEKFMQKMKTNNENEPKTSPSSRSPEKSQPPDVEFKEETTTT